MFDYYYDNYKEIIIFRQILLNQSLLPICYNYKRSKKINLEKCKQKTYLPQNESCTTFCV